MPKKKSTKTAEVKTAVAASPVGEKPIRKDLVLLYSELKSQRERVAQMVHTGYDEIEASELSDWVDLAAASHERELSIILNGNKDEVLMKIDQAIEMIETGKYGICANCKIPIAKERLKAIPFTRLCIICQEKLERFARG